MQAICTLPFSCVYVCVCVSGGMPPSKHRPLLQLLHILTPVEGLAAAAAAAAAAAGARRTDRQSGGGTEGGSGRR